ncbi:MAG: FixH family protein [Alicyclobacillus sp.]|nr:FixH family protein [Alicyclobacillus sp.]
MLRLFAKPPQRACLRWREPSWYRTAALRALCGPRTPWLWRGLVVLLAAAWTWGTMTWSAPPVSAHAYIVRSIPALDQVLPQAPGQVELWFDEPVQASASDLVVLDANGHRADQGDGHINPQQPQELVCSLQPNLPNGLYTVQWRVISADGHPVEGAIPFRIGTGPAPSAAAATTHGYLPGPGMILTRWLWYAGMALYLGGLWLGMGGLPNALRTTAAVQQRLLRLLWGAWLMQLLAVLASLPLQAHLDTGLPWLQTLQWGQLQITLANPRFGNLWFVQLLAVLLLGPVTYLLEDGWRWWTGLAGGGLGAALLVTKAIASHAADSPQPTLAMTMDALHLAAASVWVGGLSGLALLWRSSIPRHTGVSCLRRFSPWALGSVVVLASTGLYSALQHIPTWYALTHTAYGHTLLSKLALFAVMLLLAARHALLSWRAQTAATKKQPVGFGSLAGEAGTGLVILAIAALLANLPTAEANPGPVAQSQVLPGGIRASLHIAPNLAGRDQFEVDLALPNGQPDTDVQQVTLTFTSLDMDMGVQTARLTPAAPGVYKTEGVYLTMSGHWQVHLNVLTKSWQTLDGDFHIQTGSPLASS